MNEALSTAHRAHDVGALVQRISHIMLHPGSGLLSGDVAAIRRMDPERPDAPFFKLLGLVLDEVLPAESTERSRAETAWAAVVVGLGYLRALHARGRSLGDALALAGFSELRLTRLLRADREMLLDELPMLARFLSARGVPVDWSDAAVLLLSVDRKDRESRRRAIARDYYRSIARRENSAES
ncbi:MAG: type I-E CRISPR-associated protein Cse2/CasB [Deltaproteobacteria bacterium]|nr:type I-E CRISPR-associated protein Cse2/CasB [Deltaproteobacteria bacterium]